jgi:hypothetical protein
MTWQDILLTTWAWIFIIALIPAIRAKAKPPAATSLLTAIVLLIFAACYASLGLYISAISGSITATCWTILFFQKLKLGGHHG